MSGIELRDDELFVGREPNDLDELALTFSEICGELGHDHVFVSGYVAILTGRSRSTEDIDVLIERLDPHELDVLMERAREANLWGPATPLESTGSVLEDGGNVWVAREGEHLPHLEVKFERDEFDRASLDGSLPAHIGDRTLPIGPLELQIAYKLYLGTETDLDDAFHIATLFEQTLREPEIQDWVERLGVEEEYDRFNRRR